MIQTYIGTTNYGRHWLDAPAAESWFRMVRDGCPPDGITDAGRTQQQQIDVFTRYFTTVYASSAKFDRRVWNGQVWWRDYRPGTTTPWPSAATPGSIYARHTTGNALDLNGSTKAWVRANGHHYGWIKDVVADEDWHMEYQYGRDAVLASNPGGSTGNVPNVPDIDPIDPLEDDMTPEQDRMLRAVYQALGAGGAEGGTAGGPDDTVLAYARATHKAVDALPVKVWDAPITADDGDGAQTHSAAKWLTVMAFRVRDLWTLR